MNKTKKTCKDEKYEYISLNDYETYFYIYDLYLTAFLMAIGFKLISVDSQNLSKVLFVIKREFGLEEKVNEYFFGRPHVSARAFSDSIKILENKIYK